MFFKLDDLKVALRRIRQRPLGAAAIIGMLALGIGASTAMFSVVYGVLLRPLPFPDADRLFQVFGTRLDRGWLQLSLTEANFWDLKDRNHTFEALGVWRGSSAILQGDTPEQVSAAFVSPDFFRALGVTPVAGRLFRPGDDVPSSGGRPVILSHALWVRRYGSDRSIVGQTIRLGGGPRAVIGVLPPGTPWLNGAELFAPFPRRADANRSSFEFAGIGRLKPGVSMETALADLQAISKDLERQYPATNTGISVTLTPSADWIASDALRRTLWILLGSVAILLLIAAVNVTNLLLARATARARESAVRAALGAGRGVLIREWLTESIVLSVIATAIGLGVAYGLLQAVRNFDPGQIPRLADVSLNGWAFAFAAGVALLIGIATGLVPALQTPQADVITVLRHGQRGAVGDRRQARLRGLLVGTEVALSVMVLIGAGLLVRSLVNVLSVDRGFQADNRLLATVSIPAAGENALRVQTVNDVMARVQALPEVVSAATVSGRPLTPGDNTGLGLAAMDRPDPGGAVPWATWRIVSLDYFKTMGLPLLAGRNFAPSEEIAKPWRVIISQRVAEMFWPGESPVGKTLILWKGQGDNQAEVIGVVANMRERGLEADPTLAVYFPSANQGATMLQLVMHTRRRPEEVVPAFRGAVMSVRRDLAISNIRTLDDMVSASVATRRFTMLLLASFAVLALVLAAAGVYGVLAYAVSRRTSEIGVRLALGAQHLSVLKHVVAQGLRPVAIGLVAGVAGAFWVSQLAASLLFGITARDPLTFVGVSLTLLAIATLACYLPARAVLRVDPVVALRVE
jgi:predicted permease